MRKLRDLLIIFIIMGSAYFTLEGLWKVNHGLHIAMFFLGGLVGIIIDLLNQNERYYKMPVWFQSLIGLLIIWIAEFASGYYLNIVLNLAIWDYSEYGVYLLGRYIPLHLYGQICLPYGVLFYMLVPFCTWFGDYIRYDILHDSNRVYSLKDIYVELFTGK